MTEIPEHLLKRSRERRAALGEGGGESPAETPATASQASASAGAPAAATPAPSPPAAAPAAPPPPPPPKPPPPYVAAAENRPKVPIWALPVVAALPLWLFIYMLGMRPVVHEPTGPLADGAAAYSNCSSCHGASGEGSGVAYQLNNGEVNQSFDTSEQMHEWIAVGTEGFAGQPYGNGRHIAGDLGTMPAWETQLTAAQIIGVACHEFYVLGGADPEAEQYAEDYALWCAPEAPGFIAAEESGEFPDPADLELPDAAG